MHPPLVQGVVQLMGVTTVEEDGLRDVRPPVFEAALPHGAPVVDEDSIIDKPLGLIEQVRRQQDGAALVGQTA